MTITQAIILGIIQGLTEFIPVSSTAHLFLAQEVLGVGNSAESLSFDIVLHLGTALALILVFWRDLIGMVVEFFRWIARQAPKYPEDRALILPVIIGTIPGVLAGLTLLKKFEEMRSLLLVGISMIIACVYFFVAEAIGARRARAAGTDLDSGRERVNWLDALWVGIAQGAAGLMAGFSRSGFTISTGRLRGLSRERATRFSFLLALVIILGAGAKTMLDLHKHPEPKLPIEILGVGFITSAIFGFLSVVFLLKYLRTHTLRPFGIYLLILGCTLIGWHLMHH
jgi:undecaprenyl-diphosphatase